MLDGSNIFIGQEGEFGLDLSELNLICKTQFKDKAIRIQSKQEIKFARNF